MSLIDSEHAHRLTNPARRQKIIDVATEIFLQYGFDNVSMDQIAYAANMGKMTLYRHFGSKYKLFYAVVEDVSCKDAPLLRGSLDRSLTIGNALYNYAYNYIELFMNRPTFAGIVILQAITHPDLSRFSADVFIRDFVSPVEVYFQEKINEGHLCGGDAKFLATYFINSILNTGNILIDTDIDREELQSESRLKDIVALFLKGTQP